MKVVLTFYGFVLPLDTNLRSDGTALVLQRAQFICSCRSSKVSCVMCCHAFWTWRDSVVLAQMQKRKTNWPESWQGTRWISLLLVILLSKVWFSSLEPYKRQTELIQNRCWLLHKAREISLTSPWVWNKPGPVPLQCRSQTSCQPGPDFQTLWPRLHAVETNLKL